MLNIDSFYQKIWKNISNSKEIFYTDSLNNKNSYKELSENIKKISHIFLDQKNQLTVIMAKKSFYHYSAIIGTVLSGNTWIPLSLENPIERNLKVISKIEPKLILTDQKFSDEILAVFEKLNIKILILNEIFENSISIKNNLTLTFNFKKNDLSMIYFTSGSTGVPKGVKISHENLSTSVTRIFPLLNVNREIWGDYHDLSFVISIPILFVCIYSGGSIYAASKKIDEFIPTKTLIENKVSCLITVPSTLERICKHKNFKEIFLSLKTIVSCGEPLPINLMELYLQNPNINFFNFYGSTEVSPWIFFHKCKIEDVSKYEDYGYAPIGKCIEGNEIAITKENLLLVRGSQVTLGYYEQEGTSHLIDYKEKKWFSMGDVVQKIDDIYLCKGRLDGQIKLNGYRIHLMDIETQIKKNSNIEDCMCIVEKINEKSIITAVIISKIEVMISELREFLKNKLPGYMIPRKVLCIKEKPLNKNGKLDRVKLKKLVI